MRPHLRAKFARWSCFVLVVLMIAATLRVPAFAQSLTAGAIEGTVTDAVTKKPVAGAVVTAAAPSGRGTARTDANGFYAIQNLAPDTYAIAIGIPGYEPVNISGVTVLQDQVQHVDQGLVKTLQSIGRVTTRAASSLVQQQQTADVYNVGAQQLGAAAGQGGFRTLYDVMQTSAGVTATGVAGRPRIRGSDVGDVAYELDGIPINDRLTGLFTTNLSLIGTQNLEVYTGGYSAQYGNAAAGVINSVVKRGTNPGFGSLTYTDQSPVGEHDLIGEYGGATPDGKLSWYMAFDRVDSSTQFANGYQPYINSQALTARDDTQSLTTTRDLLGNFHWRPSGNDDVQVLLQTGNQRLPWNVGLNGAPILGIKECNGVVVQPGSRTVTNPGVSDTGIPCTVTTTTNGVTTTKNTGLQYYALNQTNANVWYHWSNIGKVEWNHVINDKLFTTLRVAENFNQYIFYQPFDLTTINGVTTPGAPAGITGYTPPGTPAANGIGYQDEYSDRRSQMYIGSFDATYTPNAHSSWTGGVSYERDNDAERYYDYCGCDDATSGSPFNMNGSYPNLFLNVDYPLILPSAYLDTRQTFGKLTVEPSIRYDSETYDIPNRPDIVNPDGSITKSYAYGAYGTEAWEPRFAFTWAPNAYSAIRGSYGVTSTFVPAAYVYNDSPNGLTAQDSRVVDVYYPGSGVVPQRNYNVDLSYEQELKDGVDSFRVTPFYRHATNKLEQVKTYTVAPGTNAVTFTGPSYFRTGIENRATGVELAFSHALKHDGFSWYLDGTYVNYWGSLTAATLATGSTPYGAITSSSSYLTSFLTTGTMYRNPSQPPWSVSFTGDYRKDRFHADPYVIYQVGAPYNVAGTCENQSYTLAKCPANLLDSTVHFARANWWTALDIGYDVVKVRGHVVTLGLNVRNLFDNVQGDVYPATNGNYGTGKSNPDLATYGPGSVPNTLYYYAPDQYQREFQLYLSTKF
ncbi:MAG TPA: TonB-dependent receptor [Candidatus Limnocylindria bacterium]|nr:TonB-dependent receptor [Candidatus Limnocylindria bacterium]